MSYKLLLLSLAFSAQVLAVSQDCSVEVIENTKHEICKTENGKVVTKFFDKGEVSSISYYKDGKIIKERNFSSSGNEVTRSTFEHLSDGTRLVTYYMGDFNKPRSKKRVQDISNVEVVLEEYGFHHRTGALESIDVIENGITVKRKIIENDKHEFSYIFNYDGERIIGFEAIDLNGKKIGDYSQNSIESLPTSTGNEKVKIAIIDSGFDHQHEDLIDHISINYDDPIDGVDNDGDGLVDNYLGSFYDENGDLSFSHFASYFDSGDWGRPSNIIAKTYGIPFETISLNRPGKIDSHGTHVASLALRDLESTSLIPFAGDYGDAKYLKLISQKIKSESIDFVNMSFSFPHYATGDLPRSTLDNLRSLIMNNPDTVFFVAAGNDGKLFDGTRFNCLYPACYSFDNVVTIGATEDSDWRNDNIYKMAKYSNYGKHYVDLFAPGTKVEGALLGDMKIRYTGTSMASPMALNIAAKLKELFPNKSALEIKDAMELGATKLDVIDSEFGVISFENSRNILESI